MSAVTTAIGPLHGMMTKVRATAITSHLHDVTSTLATLIVINTPIHNIFLRLCSHNTTWIQNVMLLQQSSVTMTRDIAVNGRTKPMQKLCI